ncbi:TnsA-like heteromeric transposase endonuclease subunit [Nocardia sp. NPDC046763]|uniref:TnsA-like heteromeric transposase endonuclease subunit n=1 Tax=Nocardia sp. NPDC046763 TaxID=3155256 RepID=UPI0033C8915B
MAVEGHGNQGVGLTGSSRGSDVAVRYRRGDGSFVDTTLRRLPFDDVLSGRPVREFRSWKGRKHYSGWYWSATMLAHVAYESRLEMMRILVADQNPSVVKIASQPFRLQGFDDSGVRHRHVPDILLEQADAGLTLIDVKSVEELAKPEIVALLEWTRNLCDKFGLTYEIWSGDDPIRLANLRFLAGYRRSTTLNADLVPFVLRAAQAPIPMSHLENQLAHVERTLLIRPVILHLLWRGWLLADLSKVLSRGTMVSVNQSASEETRQ